MDKKNTNKNTLSEGFSKPETREAIKIYLMETHDANTYIISNTTFEQLYKIGRQLNMVITTNNNYIPTWNIKRTYIQYK